MILEDFAEVCPKCGSEEMESLDVKEATYGGNRSVEDRKKMPNYGFRWEYDGERIFGFRIFKRFR